MLEKSLLFNLNSQQKDVLNHNKGPLIILAGAGCGKTKLVTHKYAHLYRNLENKNSTILTLTNNFKAIAEIKNGVSLLLSKEPHDAWIETVYSKCNKILRKESDKIGINNNFIVYNVDDQYDLIRHILKDLNLHEALYKGLFSKIRFLKASSILPEALISSDSNFDFDEKIIKVYIRYQDEMKRSNALDLDDLVLYTTKLFEKKQDVLKKYQRLFSYILVDDFQQLNDAQYNLLCLLANGHKNICIMFDDDQSMSKFNSINANRALKQFEKSFPDTKYINLDQSYRCTKNILNISNSFTSKNSLKGSKAMWTERENGEKVYHCWFMSEIEEAKYIAKTIKELYLKGKYAYNDISILFRVSLQLKILKDALKNEKIPFKIISESSFYLNKDFETIISFFRLIINKYDNMSLRRIINMPLWGLSAATIKKIEGIAKKEDINLHKAIIKVSNMKGLSSTIKKKLNNFTDFIKKLSNIKSYKLSEAFDFIDDLTDFFKGVKDKNIMVLNEFLANNNDLSIYDFIDILSLSSPEDKSILTDAVTILPLDNVKGHEFSVVFITGFEDGILPYFKAIKTSDGLDEERRLFYQGITRAKEMLFITGSQRRKLYSKYREQEPSRFLKEIPKDCCIMSEKRSTNFHLHNIFNFNKLNKGNSIPFRSGCRVKHPKWGLGIIRDCYGDDKDYKVTVNFSDFGLKRLSLRHANLERI